MTTAVQASTDRGDTSLDSGVGVDTLAVVGPTDVSTLYGLNRIRHERHVDQASGEVIDHGYSGSLFITVGGATVGISAWEGRSGAEMRLQASVPHMLRGHNWDGAGPGELPRAVDRLLGSVARELPGVPAPDEVRVTRVDLTRDFQDVRSPNATLSAIARHPMPRATVNHQYLRPDGKIQTLMRGNKNHWVARGYDKFYEALQSTGLQRELAKVRSQQLRFEVELRSKELRHRGITSVDDLLTADLTGIAHDYFKRCRFDVNSAQNGLADLLERLTADKVTCARQRNLLVYLMCVEYDGSAPLSRGPFEEARALANRYNLGPGSLGTSTFTRRLDFIEGREVVD
jgi:GH24 family phage-related lysozyme (muramidase)